MNRELTDCYEVVLTTSCVVFVRGAESEKQAMEFALEELPIGVNVVDAEAMQLRAHEVDSARRHADERSEP